MQQTTRKPYCDVYQEFYFSIRLLVVFPCIFILAMLIGAFLTQFKFFIISKTFLEFVQFIQHKHKKVQMMKDKLIENNQKQQKEGVPVYANVYHFWKSFNSLFGCCGIGVYHTGIEVDGVEYMYYGFDGDQSGVIGIHPYTAAYAFQQQILLGYVFHSYYQLHTKVIQSLEKEYIGNQYDLLGKNCNHFSRSMAQKLGLQQKIPRKIFCVTDCLNYLRCCIPNCILNGRLDWFNWGQQSQPQNQLMEQLDNYQVMPEHLTESHRIKQTFKDEKFYQFESLQNREKRLKQIDRQEDSLDVKVLKRNSNNQKKIDAVQLQQSKQIQGHENSLHTK